MFVSVGACLSMPMCQVRSKTLSLLSTSQVTPVPQPAIALVVPGVRGWVLGCVLVCFLAAAWHGMLSFFFPLFFSSLLFFSQSLC